MRIREYSRIKTNKTASASCQARSPKAFCLRMLRPAGRGVAVTEAWAFSREMSLRPSSRCTDDGAFLPSKDA